jgi:hypothetical protein
MVSIGSMTRFYTLWFAELRQIRQVIRDSLFPIRKPLAQCDPRCFPLARLCANPGAKLRMTDLKGPVR